MSIFAILLLYIAPLHSSPADSLSPEVEDVRRSIPAYYERAARHALKWRVTPSENVRRKSEAALGADSSRGPVRVRADRSAPKKKERSLDFWTGVWKTTIIFVLAYSFVLFVAYMLLRASSPPSTRKMVAEDKRGILKNLHRARPVIPGGLPSALPESDRCVVFAASRRDALAGDVFYDAFWGDEGKSVVVVENTDVAGKTILAPRLTPDLSKGGMLKAADALVRIPGVEQYRPLSMAAIDLDGPSVTITRAAEPVTLLKRGERTEYLNLVTRKVKRNYAGFETDKIKRAELLPGDALIFMTGDFMKALQYAAKAESGESAEPDAEGDPIDPRAGSVSIVVAKLANDLEVPERDPEDDE
ncbi:MAG: hypothetical protein GF419_06305 [Ignavibacteriales bacterium]|nr:hypothetical protein [Ignavibacteriales bacterium]